MQLAEAITRIKGFEWNKHRERLRAIFQSRPTLLGFGVLGILFLVNLVGLGDKPASHIIERGTAIDFQKGRILNDRESTFYHGKERLLSQKAQAMLEGQTKLEARLADLEKKLLDAQAKAPTAGVGIGVSVGDGGPSLAEPHPNLGVAAPGSPSASPGDVELKLYDPPVGLEQGSMTPLKPPSTRQRVTVKGPDLIAFPVKTELRTEGVVLPAGSYVKAKVLTGVDVPEGKTYPVLMVLDFSYVAPNDHKIDLAGCFMIAKAEGDLSTERVQMQATKLSCVSKKGKMFERDVNGFVADDKDGSFAMKGQVNSKQGRVAAMAFMAGVVEGVGKAVQAAQSTQTTNALGGSSSIMSGDSTKFALAGGASNAAGMVAQWYLQQAQSLAPTVEIGSGRDVWIIMKDKVSLPEEFFKKERMGTDESVYSYFTRVLE